MDRWQLCVVSCELIAAIGQGAKGRGAQGSVRLGGCRVGGWVVKERKGHVNEPMCQGGAEGLSATRLADAASPPDGRGLTALRRTARLLMRIHLTKTRPFGKIADVVMPPSSRGLGRGPFKAKTGIRIPMGALGRPGEVGFLV